MFEAHVLHLLRRYLGEYVHGLSVEALRISVWKGDVVLKDLKLKAEALNSLKLPVTVKAGFIGTITLKVPWKSLGKEPVIVLIDRVFILAHPAPDGRSLKEEDRIKLFEAKLRQIDEAESATLEAISRSKSGSSPAGNSWLGSLIATIIGNLKITISNVHVRYEDSASNPGHPFSCGVTLARLAAVTMDEQGNETFDTSGALDKLRKSLQLDRLAVYHDSNSFPWNLEENWEDLAPDKWIEIFEAGVNESKDGAARVSSWAQDRNYLVSPINGALKYHRLGNQERNDPDVAFEKASLNLSDVSLTITEAQYHDWIKLMEVISRYKTYIEVSHLRPVVTVSENPNLWWRYATQATLQQKKICYRFSWDSIQNLCHLRRRYIQLYAGVLQHLSNVNVMEIRDIESDLDPKVILLWRFLAHAKVESVKSKEAAEQRMLKKGWFSLRWLSPSEEASAENASGGSHFVGKRFSKEEWQAINKLLSFQPEEEMSLQFGKDMQNTTHYLISIFVSQAAARIVSITQTEIVCCRFEQLQVSTKFKHRSTHCDVTLKYCGLSAPEGSLAQSVCSKEKMNALAASFVYTPVGENVDWRLSATISPCHVTVFMESYERLLDFIKRSSAVSPTIALETATALQNKFEEVTRRAQEQFQMVLEEQSRFALEIDFDAPKVRLPIRKSASSLCDSHLLFDFGHFTLHTEEDKHSGDSRPSLYSRFYISGRDIAAFFTDCSSDSSICSLASPNSYCQPSTCCNPEDSENFYSLIDRCGMAVFVDQIKVPHPSHPSTRISVEVPSLGIHFSPNRYRRIMELLIILHNTTQNGAHPVESFPSKFISWNPADLETEARILVWRGIGYSVAAWQPCFVMLSGLYLYVLDSESSQSYQRSTSMGGKQVYEVSPNNVGGSTTCVAVSGRGLDTQKALESVSTLIIEFQDEEEKDTWLRVLVQATYRASAPASVDILGEVNVGVSEFADPQANNMKKVDVIVNGTVVETKLSLYGKAGDFNSVELQETPIVELLAIGGKVLLVFSQDDLNVKMKLHSLMIKDEIRSSLSMDPQYLVCSVLKDDHVFSSTSNSHVRETSIEAVEDEALFRDALSDFGSFPDSPEALRHDMDQGIGKGTSSDIFYEAEGADSGDFVSVTYLAKNPSSPYYEGIDTQMNICMSKLEFFCNRPTLIALINFGFDLSSLNSQNGSKSSNDESSVSKDKIEDRGQTFVKGLLGFGKGRIVFNLKMNVKSVAVFLNKEDGTQLAMFVQESFYLDLKVHPSSISIEGVLGNFRLCDLSLGSDCCWSWLCDIRNQEAESLIQFMFSSYSAEEDDYEGYDYSLTGQLSAVRIVFLYRFVQEITAYFMDLATPHSEEVVKFVDKVGGLEWLIQKYEMDGASALKLDLSLDTPLIIVPRDSISKDCIQLDLGRLRVKNEFSWHGCPEKDPSAVHLDVLDAEILGINMVVGINGCLGKAMIREGQNIHVYVRRSLRDIFRKVPTLALEVKVGSLHAMVSDKEYSVILDCLCMNVSEKPKIPPSFRGHKSASKDTIRMLADKVNMNSQVLLSRTVTIMAVEVEYALLELYYGIDEESTLAHITLEGLWVSYRMTALSEADLYLTIPRFSILDARPDTKSEMRLMLGSSCEVSKQLSSTSNLSLPNSTMFLMDYRWRLSSQSFVVRVQQPRILVVPDFLLAVAEFFVPALGKITGREELLDPKSDPICKNGSIALCSSHHRQKDDIVHLSQNKQLVADALGVDEYTYDGCGKTICLSEVKESKDMHSWGSRPIIIIGCGKRLRFMNVRIENSSLLRKYVYLSNNSSYSVSPEDGVELLLLENYSSNSGDKTSNGVELLSCASNDSEFTENESNARQNLSFEAQVVSAEFTFYDGSKSFLDDSSHCEKLLRAKTDFSFMYTSKDNDTWIRTLLKDLTVEAGSGLVILNPVDISGGYTSLKDRTNISLMSSDIFVHLSLSVISLVLNLHNQAAAALQFGNADPLTPCTNFERIWVSPTENGRLNNLTFWRPRASSNYVTLGDCVTSRPIPPSQAVMAVSNSYGRVRKPIGFRLVGFFSKVQGLQEVESHCNYDGDCSLWLPIAPPGYMAVGCVVHIGSEPPQNHIVYCLRSDLVTSSSFLECMSSAVSNSSSSDGFSIWRVDNVFGSFYAHLSPRSPPRDSCCDLNHLLCWNSSHYYSSFSESITDFAVANEDSPRQTSTQSARSSRWGVVRSMSKATNCCMSTPNFERIWWDKGNDMRRPVSIWRPISYPGYAVLGDCITDGLEPPSLSVIFKANNPEVSAKPVQFTKVAHIVMKSLDEAFFWYPIAPPGYASLGCIVSRIDEPPSLEHFCCPRMDLVNQASIQETPISVSSSSKASYCWSIWKVENQAHTFLARSDMKKPSSRLGFTIGNSFKPKTRDNITTEMKLRCISITILDSLREMLTPLFDVSISNVKLATHGRMEEMNAVLISSIATSSFNAQLEAWEPLVEPFDGIFKFETYDTNLLPSSSLGKRARVAATSTLNINLSSANVDTLTETITSWRRQRELEQKVVKINEEARGCHGPEDDSNLSALDDDDDFQALIIENKLGCAIYLKKVEQNLTSTELLPHNDSASVWIPPLRYSERLNIADESRETRCYVCVHIFEAKDLPIADDGNSHNFFCALRLLVDNQDTIQQRVFPQSARTKCVRPFASKIKDFDVGNAKWNEMFIFEVPRKGMAKLEVEVTNLAAKAGKGEVVAALSFPVGNGTNTLWKVASAKMLHQASDVENIVSYPLQIKGQLNDDGMHPHGSLLASTSYFERKTFSDTESDKKCGYEVDNDIGFWVALSEGGAWEGIRSFLPLSVITKSLEDDFVAIEVVMKNGRKHAIFRSLASVTNDSDVKLDILVTQTAMIQNQSLSSKTTSHSATINPGSSSILPWKYIAKDSNYCLQVRPCFDQSELPCSWGYPVATGSGYTMGKDQTTNDPGSLFRQSSLKRGNKSPSSSFNLNQLEKKDVLFGCHSNVSQQIWLSVGTDASALHTDLNAPVYDWRISISSPLKLENRLPCPVKFTIWEKLRDGNNIKRQQGIILSRGSVHVYSADVRNPIYLALSVQGGWVMEKDPVLILDLLSNVHVSSFWIIQQQRKRRLRVSIERNMGGSFSAPKTIRFFVPYWVTNESSLPLAYRVVEIETLGSSDMDSVLPSQTTKSAKAATETPGSVGRKRIPRKNVQILEAIEDTNIAPSMLSPQDYIGRGGVMLFSSKNDTYLSPRVGIAVAIQNCENYSPGISLLELEKKQRVNVEAFCSEESYYKLSATLQMTSDRTKVIHYQPHTLFINRLGCSLCLRQIDSHSLEWIHPLDSPKHFAWLSSKAELVEVCLDGNRWSTPFNVGSEGIMCISLRNETGSDKMQLKVEVRSGSKSSHYEVIFRPYALSSPYRIENRSMFLPIQFRQVDGNSDSWRSLLPNSAASFSWENIGRQHLLELLVDGTDPLKSQKYNIDVISDHQPISVAGEVVRALRVTILKEEKINVIKINDWIPELEIPANCSKDFQSMSAPNCEFHVIFEVAELGLSVIDYTPEEILYLSIQNLLLSYSTGLGSGISRFKLRMRSIQVDNQLPLTPMPVLFRSQRIGEERDYMLKFSVTQQSNGSLDLCVYPYIGFQGPENCAFLINIHEPIIWRLHGMFQQANLDRLHDTKSCAVSVDPVIQICVLNIYEVRFKVSMAMSPTQRPVGVLGFWSSLMTALGNTENMPVRINQRFQENVRMRQSVLVSNAISNIKKDLLGQPLQLLSGVDILGNASSALGHMSKGVAALSMDKKFIQSRQKQENKGVEDIGDVIREGGGALAKGLFRGVTGILTKPYEGAKASGVEGFVQGVGKGIIGAAAQPVSGVLDLLSKTTEGANAMRMKIASVITSDDQLLRKRLPRVIGGDNLLRPYDEHKAEGQITLQLAESGSFFGQVDLFKVRAKFALSDAYEDHFLLPKGKILVVTHRRVILLQQPSNIIAQKKFNPARDPCSVLWDVLWDGLVTMELTHGKKDNLSAPPSCVILHIRSRYMDAKDQARVVKCHRDCNQAVEVYSSIMQAMNTYGPVQSNAILKRKVTKPYSPILEPGNAEEKEGDCSWSPQRVPAPDFLNSNVDSSAN